MSRRKRTLLAVGLLVVTSVMGMIGVRALVSREASAEQLIERVQIGMSRDEVAGALGRQHDGAGYRVRDPSRPPLETMYECSRTWNRAGGGGIYVEFDDDGKASSKGYLVGGIRRVTLLGRLRLWLGL